MSTIIKSIIQAKDWYACFSTENDKIIVDPVAVWVNIIDEEDGDILDCVEGYVSIDYGLGSAENIENFACYLSKEEVQQARARGDVVERD